MPSVRRITLDKASFAECYCLPSARHSANHLSAVCRVLYLWHSAKCGTFNKEAVSDSVWILLQRVACQGAIDLYHMILSSFYLDHVLIDQYYIYNRIHLCLSSSLQIWNTSEKAAPELSTDKQACIAGVRGGRALFLFVCCESFEAYKH